MLLLEGPRGYLPRLLLRFGPAKQSGIQPQDVIQGVYVPGIPFPS